MGTGGDEVDIEKQEETVLEGVTNSAVQKKLSKENGGARRRVSRRRFKKLLHFLGQATELKEEECSVDTCLRHFTSVERLTGASCFRR